MNRTLMVSICFAALLAGCGSSPDDTAGAGGELSSPTTSTATSPAPETSTATADPIYVESATCRKDMAPLLDIMRLVVHEELDDPDVFDRRVDALGKDADDATIACTKAVNKPVRELIYKWTLAKTYLYLCKTGQGKCKSQEAAQAIFDGEQFVPDIDGALEATLS